LYIAQKKRALKELFNISFYNIIHIRAVLPLENKRRNRNMYYTCLTVARRKIRLFKHKLQ